MHIFTCHPPLWFIGLDVFIELIFVVTTLFIAYYSYKAYKIANHNSLKFFSLGFILMGLSYLTDILSNSIRFFQLTTNQIIGFIGIQSTKLPIGFILGSIRSILLVAGLTFLIYSTLKTKDKLILKIFILLSIIPILISTNSLLLFNVISSVLFIAIIFQYYHVLEKKRNTPSLYNFLGFGFIFLGFIQIGIAYSLPIFYVSGHIISLFGYSLLLRNLFRVVKK